MSEPSHTTIKKPGLSIKTYTLGFIGSLLLTLLAYSFVSRRSLSIDGTAVAVVGLALVQFVVQLLAFLHIGHEMKPRYKLLVFVFMLFIAAIIVFGSVWIMDNLNTRMTPNQQLQYMNDQDGL